MSCGGADTTGGRLTSPAGEGNEDVNTGASVVSIILPTDDGLGVIGTAVLSSSVGFEVTSTLTDGIGVVSPVGSGVMFIIVGIGVGRDTSATG